jgi:GH25 family lysozyme M1 (1,4-beta-N-acetylmuramidase)
MVAQFVDISSFQGNIDFVAYRAWAASFDGITRIAMKSSEGIGFIDPLFAENRANALAAGIDCIYYYHFGRPSENNAIDEAKWQKQVVGGIRAADMLVLDFEENVPQATAEWAYEWLAQQEDSYGKPPGLYASSAYIQQRLQDQRLAQFSLWLANWQFTPDERPACPPPWTSYEFVQYTDQAANIPGVASVVDADIFLGGNTPMPPVQPGTNQLIAANNRWNAVLKENAEAGLAPTGTGIYETWLSDYIKGVYHGPPLTHEYNSVDWSGNQIVVQEFAYGWCEWGESAGLLGWYGSNGKI